MTTAITSLLQLVTKCYDSLNMSLSNNTAKFLFCCAVKEAYRVSHGGRGGKVRSGKLEGRGGQHFSLLEIFIKFQEDTTGSKYFRIHILKPLKIQFHKFFLIDLT